MTHPMSPRPTTDVSDLLEQSSAEAMRSLRATDPREAAVHHEQCLLYTSRALAALIARRVAFPFERAA